MQRYLLTAQVFIAMQVLSVLLLLCCVALARSASAQPGKPTAAMVSLAAAAASSFGSSSVSARSSNTPAGSSAAATGGAASSTSSSSSSQAGWQLFAARAPPVMCDVALSSPEDALPGTAVPADPYTSLKQNYDGLVQFLTLVSSDMPVDRQCSLQIQHGMPLAAAQLQPLM
jgi:hypothetical protein